MTLTSKGGWGPGSLLYKVQLRGRNADPIERCINELGSPFPPAPSSPLRVFPVTTWIKLRAPLLGFLWNNRSYCNQILPSRKNFMQLARTLHSQETEKSFFVLSLNTWKKLSPVGGGLLPGPTVERGLPGPNHIPACRRPATRESSSQLRLHVAQFQWNLQLAGATWQREPCIHMGGWHC